MKAEMVSAFLPACVVSTCTGCMRASTSVAPMPSWVRRSRMSTERRAPVILPLVAMSPAERGVQAKVGRPLSRVAGVIQR